MFLTLLGTVLMTAAPQQSTLYGDVDGWIVRKLPKGCYLLATYDATKEHHQEFTLLHERPTDMATLVFLDSTWNFGDADRNDYSLVIDRADGSPAWVDLSGDEAPEDKGASIALGFDVAGAKLLIQDLIGAKGIVLKRGGEQIANLDIAGNEKAFAMLAECAATVSP